jgi:hypothetical protein
MKNGYAEEGGAMKQVMLCFLMICIFTIPSFAETDSPQQQTGTAILPCGQQAQMKCPMMQSGPEMPMMHGGQQMQGMMQMCPRMGQMLGHGMMVRDVMQMMMDMIKMQQKMIRGLSPVEKKEMIKDADKMLERMEKMMSEMRGMVMHGMIGQPAQVPPVQQEPAQEKQKESPPAIHQH